MGMPSSLFFYTLFGLAEGLSCLQFAGSFFCPDSIKRMKSVRSSGEASHTEARR
jgi:hypothetical protein